MFTKATPESAGISSKAVLGYLKMINTHELASHSILIARGDKLICEAYWKPFDARCQHRMYSQTKSYVGLAVRLLADEGRISLNDKIISYFPEKLPEKIHPFLAELSIKNMLMMRTCFDERAKHWFTEHNGDRVKLYFSQEATVYPGTQYSYDSSGSFVLGALVEKLTGKTFLDYLRDRCLRKTGFSEDARCLKCPGGYSWSDSALLCTPLDMLTYGRFVGTNGQWENKQLISPNIIRAALNDVSDNNGCTYRSFSHCGYLSQFWKYYGNSIGFNGMHDQCTVYDPDTDITFTCTSGNFRTDATRELLMSYLFTQIINEAAEAPLPEDEKAFKELEDYINGLELTALSGAAFSGLEKEISGKSFKPLSDECYLREFSFTFENDRCVFRYKNAQGNKEIVLGRLSNVFGRFPETGYSKDVGGEVSEGHTYKCASSFAWGTENQMNGKVQIIDEYIGNFYFNFSYRDGWGRLRMRGDGENFLQGYNGAYTVILDSDR